MTKTNDADRAPVHAIVMPLCSVCRVQLTEEDKLAEQRVFKNGELQYIELHHQKCSTDCMYCKHYEESVESPEDGWCHHCNESTSATETCDWHESA